MNVHILKKTVFESPDTSMIEGTKNLFWVVPNERSNVVAKLTEAGESEDLPTIEIPLPTSQGLRRVSLRILREPKDMQGLNFWASEAAMSRRSFTRNFNKETGLSFVQWRQRVKIAAAIQRIFQGQSVAQSSSELGYKTTSAFISVFRKHYKTTPARFVKDHS